MGKAVKIAPEPWQLQDGQAVVAVKDARGQIICWLNKSHPQLQGNTLLLHDASTLAQAVFNFLAGKETKEELAAHWKFIRGVK